MSADRVESGLLAGMLPYVRVGHGRPPLVVLPGLADAAWDVTRRAEAVAEDYRRFAADFTVYIVSRQRGLPPGCTTRAMAAQYAPVLEHEIGPAMVLGISLGGCVAQHLAAEFPHCVERLVIACAAYRVSKAGRLIPEHWLALAHQGRWTEFYCDIAKVTLQEYHHTFYQFLRPWLRLRPGDPTDFLTSLRACLAHDGTAALERIRAPTLIIGGAEDIFFPPVLLHATAARIPLATMRLIDGGRHGAYASRRAEFEQAVLEFLRAPRWAAWVPRTRLAA